MKILKSSCTIIAIGSIIANIIFVLNYMTKFFEKHDDYLKIFLISIFLGVFILILKKLISSYLNRKSQIKFDEEILINSDELNKISFLEKKVMEDNTNNFSNSSNINF